MFIPNKQNIHDKDKVLKNYLLYISKAQYFLIPENAFVSDTDKEWFENNVLNRIKKG